VRAKIASEVEVRISALSAKGVEVRELPADYRINGLRAARDT
jgi:hypothetical protein